MFRAKGLLVLVACLTTAMVGAQSSQGASAMVLLFEQLQSPETTDQARAELYKTAETNAEARKYLTAHLPELIERGPTNPKPWSNAARLAGELKIVEAVPALAKWIAEDMGGLTTLSQSVKLTSVPAGKALAQIGDPSVPALAEVLQHGTERQRWNAAYALNLIGSARAKKAMQEHLGSEPDTSMRDFMQRALENWKSSE